MAIDPSDLKKTVTLPEETKVSINERQWTIPKNTPTEVPMCVYEVLQRRAEAEKQPLSKATIANNNLLGLYGYPSLSEEFSGEIAVPPMQNGYGQAQITTSYISYELGEVIDVTIDGTLYEDVACQEFSVNGVTTLFFGNFAIMEKMEGQSVGATDNGLPFLMAGTETDSGFIEIFCAKAGTYQVLIQLHETKYNEIPYEILPHK